MRFITLLLTILLLKVSLFSIQGEFSNGELKESSLLFPERSYQEVIDKKTVFCKTLHYSHAWGHAVQDVIIPIYQHIKKHHLLHEPICICIQLPFGEGVIFERATGFLKTIFPHADVKYLFPQSPPCFFKDVEIASGGLPQRPDDEGVLMSRYMELMRSYDFANNVSVQLPVPERNIVHDFVDHVLECYNLKDVQMVPKRVHLINKGQTYSRRILNLEQVAKTLRSHGYEVLTDDFETMSVHDQIMLSRSCQFYISTHGAALTNTMFLHTDANVLIIWPENAKYFHNRFYCPFTSILLSRGIKLIEYDKPYSKKDVYTILPNIQVPEYFYRAEKRVLLRPEKRNWADILQFPRPCMYDIYNVNMVLEKPDELIWLMRP